MATYRPPLTDVRFLLEHVVPLDQVTRQSAFSHVESDIVDGLLEEAGRFAAEVVAPTNQGADRQGVEFRDGVVSMPAELVAAQRQFVASGWGAIAHHAEFGGGGFPHLVANFVKEFITSANMAFALGPLLTTGATLLLTRHGSQDQVRRYVPRMVTGEWSGTMNLTEPQAGSDLGAVTTKAIPADDGTFRLTGQKIFITYGEHDLTEQIVHLVLARLPDAPPGTRGLSLFIVPKYLVDDDGDLGARNDVVAASVEHKLGIHASPTCVMVYGGQSDGAVAELVGEPHQGMPLMFTMMNDARLGVGLEGVAIAERAYQQAVQFARERRQGVRDGVEVAIVDHPDVQRMLITQRACIEAARALCAATAAAIDLAQHADDPGERDRNAVRADLLTPLAKAWPTDLGVTLTSLALQVHGGMGYIEETGAAQHLRDARITPIYEGTNGIQAIDLVGRKIMRDQGDGLAALLADLREMTAGLPDELSDLAVGLGAAIKEVERIGDWIVAQSQLSDDVLAGASPALRVIAATTAAALVARGAATAHALLDERDEPSGESANGRPQFSSEWLAARIATATFFITQVLPEEVAAGAAATAGSAVLDAVAADPDAW
ncbi:MAG: acyl-CoA dehydrogenase family protein [Nitriliruptoraceae bacterium]